jgi:hypothetical protein
MRLLCTSTFLFQKITITSNFGGISKFLKLIVFGKILTKCGSDGQFWADSAAMAEVDSMPSCKRKKKKPSHLEEELESPM